MPANGSPHNGPIEQSRAWPAATDGHAGENTSPKANGHPMNPTHTTNNTTVWYVVLTKPKQEQRAKQNLERQGGTVYLPLFSNERILRGKRVKRDEPLFPGYLFLNCPSDSPLLSKVRSTFGVRQLLTFAGQVMTVDNRIIEDLQQRSSTAPQPQFSAGQSVRIKQGPFQDYQAIFQTYDGEERGIILLSLLGQQNEVVIKLAELHAS